MEVVLGGPRTETAAAGARMLELTLRAPFSNYLALVRSNQRMKFTDVLNQGRQLLLYKIKAGTIFGPILLWGDLS